MDRETELELYDLAEYAQRTGKARALKWIMKTMQEPRQRPRQKVRVRLKGGGSAWISREALTASDALGDSAGVDGVG